MKIISLILGIFLTLTSESYSYDQIDLGTQSTQVGQDEPSKSSASKTGNSRNISRGKTPSWIWGNGIPLSSSELSYLEADLETLKSDWSWGNGNLLTLDESADISAPLSFPNWVQASETPITPPLEKKIDQTYRKKIFLTANHMTHDNKRGLIWAWGKVVIRLEDRILKADKVRVNNNTGDGKAVGNVKITRDDGTRLRAQRTLFNINNEQGRIFETRGRLGKSLYIKGKEITRYSENHYKLEKGHLTTCEGILPDWVFEAESMDILVGDRALFTKGVFKIKDIPIMYIPVGYVPINQDRKSGFLFPSFGSGTLEGITFDNEYYWAIDDHSDATFSLGYTGRRGFHPGVEYRYTPSGTTKGIFQGSYTKDKLTRSTFWEINAVHQQILPYDFEFEGKLELESEEFNRNFEEGTEERAQRNSESFATITKSWDYSTLDILTRYRDSSEFGNDQTFAELPQITYKVPKYVLGDSNFYFNLDTSFSSFLTDLDPDPDEDFNFSVQRFDFHPQISYTGKITPWLSFTPTIGVRETFYSEGLDITNNQRLGSFSRESFDISASFEGPKIQKIFETKNEYIPKMKHLIEPRFTYNFIPDLDERDREKIKILDGIDGVTQRSSVSYSLTQRVFQKEIEKDDSFSTREILRFDISQTFDLIEATGSENPEDKRPFSDLRFDLDSRLTDNIEFNADTTFDIKDNVFKTWNFEIGVKPLDSLYLSVERRYLRRGDVFTIASLDWDLKKGWRVQASSRLDELTDTNRENHLSVVYDDPCKCWGFNFDVIKRNNFRATGSGGGIGTGINETKFFLGITLRGLGTLSSGGNSDINLHRTFESIYDDPN